VANSDLLGENDGLVTKTSRGLPALSVLYIPFRDATPSTPETLRCFPELIALYLTFYPDPEHATPVQKWIFGDRYQGDNGSAISTLPRFSCPARSCFPNNLTPFRSKGKGFYEPSDVSMKREFDVKSW
jgi:hypothetical protein